MYLNVQFHIFFVDGVYITGFDDRTPIEKRATMTWARRLKRVFNIDISECEKCKGPAKVVYRTNIAGLTLVEYPFIFYIFAN